MTEQAQDAVPSGVIYPDVLHPMRDSSDKCENAPELKQRLAEDGYLLFRDVLDKDKLLALRAKITDVLAEVRWIAGGAEKMKAKVTGLAYREGEDRYFDAHDKLVRLEELYALAHDENLIRLMRNALGDSAFPHPLSITRLVFPGHPEITTPPHQDYRNNQGTTNLTASWIPLGDCRQQEGGLAVLEGSHRCGLLPIQYHLGPGNRGVVLPPAAKAMRWVSTDFRLGDVLLFPALTVHSALHNADPDHMRLSVDFRFQLEGEGVSPVCLEPHFGRYSWEEIYADWQSDQYKYYWKSKRYLPVQWDPTLLKLENDPIKQLYHDGMKFHKARNERLRKRQG
ncbi:hypothetical protein E4634_06775 [Mangrovimicrobium sediminis]|uniref:Phytanoyl-CoA dioxygenase family protein n=1 Tax=Mangrovimicrobium sediminis TaxID=2562682 RepID=A0A4Z0M5W6_9GAMM|nr:phytanoyl-CoA dioxygenase family protein [Haliea sp. SAOS-164]TGD74891.1 hypothetical protein E4634_06775 [Haliea sp. SAOS-164]